LKLPDAGKEYFLKMGIMRGSYQDKKTKLYLIFIKAGSNFLYFYLLVLSFGLTPIVLGSSMLYLVVLSGSRRQLLLSFCLGQDMIMQDKKKGGSSVANFGAPARQALNAKISKEHIKKLEEIRQRLQQEENARRTFKTITKYMTIEKIIDQAYESLKIGQ
jgi:hypothetical protein